MFDLKGFRKDRKLSQKQISDILGIGTSFISQIETGKDPMPSYIPEKLAAAYGKDEIDKYHREPVFGIDADRLLRKRYGYSASSGGFRNALATTDVAAMEDGLAVKKVGEEWIDRVLQTIERRDELALLQQREYERQGARIDELLALLRRQSYS